MFIDKKWMRFYAIMSGAVMFKVMLTVGGFFLGRYLDEQWHTYPWMTLLFVVIGISVGMAYVVYVASRNPE